MILAGDIGGTHTRLALFDNGIVIDQKKYLSQKYPSLEKIVVEFLKGKSVQKATFGVAGPVRNGLCQITNLSWKIEIENISKLLNINKVYLINDLLANAYGLLSLKEDQFFCLHHGKKQEGNRALISAGTGLGEAGLFWDGKTYRPFASEGGHADFSSQNQEEFELFIFLKKQFGHVSFERVISGPGLHAIYEFLVTTGREKREPSLKDEMGKKDPSEVISEWALIGKDAACVRAVDLFISIYGAEAGNLALKLLALGGVYIGGGIAPRLIEKMKSGLFYNSFINKGRFKSVLESIPIFVIMNEDTALLGAMHYG